MARTILMCVFALVLLSSMPTRAQKATKNSSGKSNSGSSSSTSSAGNSLLGQLEGIIRFCDKVSPGSMSVYKQVDQLFIGGNSARTLDQMRNSDAYESGFKQVTNLLKSLPGNQAATECGSVPPR